jgi:hypothetical protein
MLKEIIMLTKADVQKVLTSTKKLNPQRIKLHKLTDYTPEEMYLIYYELEAPLCDNINCINFGDKLPFKTFTKGYLDYCNAKCSNSSIKRISKIKETQETLYGGLYMNSEEFINEKKQKTLDEFGVEYYFQTDEFKSKSKKTIIERYGVDNISKDELIKKKKISTCLENYGVENPSQVMSLQDKKIETCVNKYHNYHFNGTTIDRERYPNTLIKKHIHNIIDLNQEYLNDNFIIGEFFDVKSAMSYFNVSYNIFAKTKTKFSLPPFLFNKKYTQSTIYNLFNNALLNDRQFIKPLEIDILSHENKLAIEYNGLMFHSYGVSKYSMFNNSEQENSKYHLNKTELVEEKGYQLFHIFENEWLEDNKKEIWKSMINSKLGLTERIYARKCIIKEVTNSVVREFLIMNHIQGNVNSSINYGLYYEDELVSLMTFGHARFSKKYEYELLRFCNKINTTVVGGFSKILKHFERVHTPKSLVSYANRRWSTGKVYEVNGFEFSHNSIPNYFYFKEDSNILESRNKFQKHKLKNILESFDETLSEKDNMFLNGYRRIYDCGNIVYYKEYK